MKYTGIMTIALISISTAGFAQQFITEGKIEYERKTNQHAFLDDNNVWDEMAFKSTPKFVTYYFDLTFNLNRSLYKTGREPDLKQNKWWGIFDAENTILTNLDSNTSLTQKSIYGDTYLINDSVRKIDWKISAETRKIAGFDCRKAVGKIMDSIIVIAFYAEEILASGGPESFAGLPGMILGIAIPKMHTTWYATKLQLIPVAKPDITIPKKVKKYSGRDFRAQLNEIMKNWGENSKRMQAQIIL